MDTDYIGQIQNARWNTQTSGWLMRTPSWMEGGFKSGNRISQRQFSPPSAGIQQNWGRISDTDESAIRFNSRNQIRANRTIGGQAGSAIAGYFMGGKGGAPTAGTP